MARRSADPPRGRIAVLGAASPAGVRVKSALAERGIDGARVGLFGAASEIAVLSEYDGEARVVQPFVDLDAEAHAAVFVCETGHDVSPLSRAAASGTVVVDLSGSVSGAALAGAPTAEGGGRLVVVAHPASRALAAILGPLHAALEVERASAVVLRSVSDFGEAGLEELREQTIHLLRFEKIPTDAFGRQVAFNVVPEHLLPGDEAGASSRIADECRALLGAPRLPLHVSTVLVPIFLGHAFVVHADLARGSAAEATRALAEARGVTVATGDGSGCTMDADEKDGIAIARIDPSGAGSVRLWAVAADAGRDAVADAIGVAEAAGVL